MSGPCGWTITRCGCGSCWDTYTPTVRATAGALAIGIMWMATGRRYGLCDVTVQPCIRPEPPSDYREYPVDGATQHRAYVHEGQWYNGCGTETSCCRGCELDLEGPTTTAGITTVTVNGVVVPPAAYKVMNRNILVRIDGQCWPTCNNYSEQTPATIQVTYKKGLPIPDHVQKATERLACDLAKACSGAECALPQRIRSLSRQGVEVAMDELSADPGKIRTGIHEVDMVIALENPHGRTMASLVWSPDMPKPRTIR